MGEHEIKRYRTVGVFNRKLAAIPHLMQLIGAERVVLHPSAWQARDLDAVIGWGHKHTARGARAYASRHRLPYLRLEDGFLRSAGLRSKGPPLSLVVDDLGIYYDARSACRLEGWLNATGEDDPLASESLIERARRCRDRIVEARLSKYNGGTTELPRSIRERSGPMVLVADQTFRDAAVEYGSSGPAAFDAMLHAALDENPEATVLLKVHPDVLRGRKRGYLPSQPVGPRVQVVAEDVVPMALLGRVDRVYVCTSQLGFEALLAGTPVACFGTPFYSGWGLTDDRAAVPRRRRQRTLDELVAASLLLYPRYVSPVSGERCPVEEVIEHLALQRQQYDANRGRCFCFGFSLWKRHFVRSYLEGPEGKVIFASSLASAERRGVGPGDRIVTWGRRGPAGLRDRGLRVAQMEDGFIRSVGLGSDLTAPASLVIDRQGIYYDGTRPSDLEVILQQGEFTEAEIDRARQLRELLVSSGVSKYNVGVTQNLRTQARDGQPVVLVPGQVEDDASIELGADLIRDNAALIRAARARSPEAYLIYKPHPDVVSCNRRGAVDDATLALCDQVVLDAPLADCLALASEVDTITSLVGFEALLRSMQVVVYGRPFYAGWGLTVDQISHPRRTRRLTIDELVVGTLLRYPRYYDHRIRAFVTAEQAAREIARQRADRRNSIPVRAPRAVRQLRKLAALVREVTRVR